MSNLGYLLVGADWLVCQYCGCCLNDPKSSRQCYDVDVLAQTPG